MKTLFRVGKSSSDSKFYVGGILRADGTINTKGHINEDFVDGSTSFRGESVIPEYLGHYASSDDVNIDDESKLLKMLAKLAGSDHSRLRSLTIPYRLKSNFPNRTNAFNIETHCTEIAVPHCNPDKIERYHYVLTFLSIP